MPGPKDQRGAGLDDTAAPAAMDDTVLPAAGADALAATVRRSAVTDTVVPAAMDDTVLPPAGAAEALGRTVRRSAVTDTVVPAAAADTVLPAAGTDDTMAAAAAASSSSRPPSRSGSTSEPSSAGSSTTLVRFDPDGDTLRTVGDELRSATVEQFGEVADDRFEVLSELARGGLGQVLRARDPRTGRIVAIKQVLRPNRELVVRFAREALVTANLQHPAIVPVYEVGRWHGGEPYYAMKLVKGRALDALIDEAKTGADRVALVPHVIAIADALAYAHSEHVIHRDLKPANVLVGPYGETVVIDWGLARDLASDDDVAPLTHATAAPGETVAGAVMGTPSYMAPEQAAGQTLDERADVYAIGAILYHVLAGVRPYHEAKTVDGILAGVTGGPPRALDALAPDAAPELIAIAAKAMARDRAERYPTALELAADLRRFQAGQLVGAHRYSSRELVRRWLRRHRAAAATAVIAAAALIIFGVISVRRIAAERDRAHEQTRVAERERGLARDARALAERRLADSLEELGRLAAMDGAPERALPFLAGAAEAFGRPPPALAVLLGQARLAYVGLDAIAPIDEGGTIAADLVDGRVLLTTSVNGRVRAWDLRLRRALWTAAGQPRTALSPDGAALLGVAQNGEVSLRATDDGRVLHTWRPPVAWAEDDVPAIVTWSPDGGRFAIGSTGGHVVLGAPGAPALVEAPPHAAELWMLVFAPDGSALATLAADEPAISLRDPATGAIRARLRDAGGAPQALAWRDPATLISVHADSIARQWRVPRMVTGTGSAPTRSVGRWVADGAVVRRYRGEIFPYGVAISGDGARMAVFGHGEKVALWTLDSDAPAVALPGHELGVDEAAFAGDRLVTADEVGGLRAWDAATGERTATLPAEGQLHGVRATGDRVVVFGEGRPRVWRPGLAQALRAVPGHTARVRDLAFDERGVVWSASHDGSARGFDPATGAVIVAGKADFAEPVLDQLAQGTQPAAINPHGLRSLTLAGNRLFTAAEDGVIAIWDARAGSSLGALRGHTGRVRKVVVSDDRTTAWSVGDTTVRRWELATGRETGRADLGGPGWDVAMLGDRVVTFADDPNVVGIRDATTLALVATPVRDNRLRNLVIAGDHLVVSTHEQVLLVDRAGQLVATAAHSAPFVAAVGKAGDRPAVAVGDSPGDVVLHDGETLVPIRGWRTGEPVVTAVAFRPDGAIVATAGNNRVQLWDPATGRELADSGEMPALIAQLAWSPDGHTLAFAGGSGTVWLWRVPADDGTDLPRFTACASPWRLEHAVLSAAPFDPATCEALTTP